MTKVFGIGFHKTGTTTLDTAYQLLGLNACPVRTDLVKSLARADFRPTFETVRQFDAFQDNPWPVIFRELDREFPGSKFIMTTRDEAKWYKSILNSFGGKSTEMRRWIYGEAFGDPKGNEDIYLKRYRQHHKEVVDYFQARPQDLLIVDWSQGDGWEKICPFLNLPVPAQPFPHANKGDYSGKKKKGFFSLFTKK
jgi:hypothetical protein